MNRNPTIACFLGAILVSLFPAAKGWSAEGEDASLALLKRKPVEVVAADDDLSKVLKARYNAAVQELASTHHLYMNGKATLDTAYESGRRATKAGLELFTAPAERIKLLEEWVALTESMQQAVQGKFDAGVVSISAMEQAKYSAADARVQLIRARRAMKDAKPAAK